jgi:prepilin-type N-terminal cleavage/methylation domain-containing protein
MRKGFTLIEFLIATALAGIVAAAITTTVVRQQRFYAAAQEQLELRNRLREAANILSADLKGAAVSELGVPFMSDTAVELFTSVGSSIVCTLVANVIGLPPQTLARGNTLTSIVAVPDTGDLALIYGSPYNLRDSGSWTQNRIAAMTSRAASSACPSPTGFTTAPDVAPGTTAWQLTLANSPAEEIRPGSPIHFVRRSRYSLYKSGGQWYLGYRRCNALGPSLCGAIQPVSGPFLPYSSGGAGGLGITYYNKAGAIINSSQSGSLARIDVVIRSNRPEFRTLTEPSSIAPETVKVSIALRNRAR